MMFRQSSKTFHRHGLLGLSGTLGLCLVSGCGRRPEENKLKAESWKSCRSNSFKRWLNSTRQPPPMTQPQYPYAGTCQTQLWLQGTAPCVRMAESVWSMLICVQGACCLDTRRYMVYYSISGSIGGPMRPFLFLFTFQLFQAHCKHIASCGFWSCPILRRPWYS